MDKKYIEQLARIYNALLTVSTKGEDTVVMAECLTAFRQTILNIQESMSQQTSE